MGWTAQGLETIKRQENVKFFEVLSLLCKEKEVQEVVIGLPVNMNGTLGPKAKEVMELMPLLEEALKLPVKSWDERLSSKQADRVMIEGGLSRRKQKEHSDKLAAIIILQSYLESKRSFR